MPEPQPGPGQPERAPTDSPVEPSPAVGATDGPDEPDVTTGSTDGPDEPDPATVTTDGPDEPDPATVTTDGPDEPDPALTTDGPDVTTGGTDGSATAAVPPRWTGSAQVPPPGPRKRGWLASQEIGPQPPERLNPTLELPTQERAALEDQTPVDPWADADPWGGGPETWEGHPLPPTLPYPVPPAHPAHPGPPAYQHPPAYPAPGLPPAPRAPAHPVPAPPPGPPVAPASPPWPGPVPAAPRPGSGPAPAPPAPDRSDQRRERRRERRSAPPAPEPPPGWRPPKGYVAVPVRRRRRWPWVLTVLTLLCCCGCPGWFGRPMWQQYPASAVVPAEVADLTLRDDPASRRASQRLEDDMRAAHALAEQTFAGVYAAPGNKQVTVFGAIGFRFSPDDDVDAEVARLTETYQLAQVQTMPGGERGEHRRCGVGRAGGRSIVLCSWADHGSLGTGLFTGRSVEDSADLLQHLRTSMIIRG